MWKIIKIKSIIHKRKNNKLKRIDNTWLATVIIDK